MTTTTLSLKIDSTDILWLAYKLILSWKREEETVSQSVEAPAIDDHRNAECDLSAL